MFDGEIRAIEDESTDQYDDDYSPTTSGQSVTVNLTPDSSGQSEAADQGSTPRPWWYWDPFAGFTLTETLLICVSTICALALILAVVYFRLMRKYGRFSDNPMYKRRMYYRTKYHSVSLRQLPARSFNLLRRPKPQHRPNTLHLTDVVYTPEPMTTGDEPPPTLIEIAAHANVTTANAKTANANANAKTAGKSPKTSAFKEKRRAKRGGGGGIGEQSESSGGKFRHHHHHHHQQHHNQQQQQTVSGDSSNDSVYVTAHSVYVTPTQGPEPIFSPKQLAKDLRHAVEHVTRSHRRTKKT